MAFWHASRRDDFEAWQSPMRPRPSFSASNVANTGGVSKLLSPVLTSSIASSIGTNHGSAACHSNGLATQFFPSRSAMPGRVIPHADRSVSYWKTPTPIGGSTWKSALAPVRCQRLENMTPYEQSSRLYRGNDFLARDADSQLYSTRHN
jgi:hypothetical protein